MGEFFESWQLWQKFTFVLGCAITVVFFAGWVKLQIANRRVRKYEKTDEEKRIRIQEMRQNGEIVPDRKAGPDIPFGVKALEMGAEVPGIYVERNSLKASLTASRSSGSFSDTSTAYTGFDPGSVGSLTRPGSTNAPVLLPNDQTRLSSKLSVTSLPKHVPTNPMTARTAEHSAMLTSLPHNSRTAYKPHRSSGLRFSEGTQHHEDALSALEGRPTSPVRFPVGYPSMNRNILPVSSSSSDKSNSSDEDHVSTSSSHSAGLYDPPSPSGPSRRSKVRPPLAYQTRPGSQTSRQFGSSSTRTSLYTPVPQYTRSGSNSPVPTSPPFIPEMTGAQTDSYFTLLKDDADAEVLYTPTDPFATPVVPMSNFVSSPIDIPEDTTMIAPHDPSTIGRSDESTAQEEEYGAGVLHVNKSSRISNSTFQVLPAGTFGKPAEFASLENDTDADISMERKESLLKRASRRLSKLSSGGRRGSGGSLV